MNSKFKIYLSFLIQFSLKNKTGANIPKEHILALEVEEASGTDRDV